MHVTVISPEAAIFDGEADAVTAPAYDGSLGVLPRHAPMMTLLGEGELAVRQGDRTRRFRVRADGLLARPVQDHDEPVAREVGVPPYRREAAAEEVVRAVDGHDDVHRHPLAIARCRELRQPRPQPNMPVPESRTR